MTDTTACPLCGKHCAPVRHPYGVTIGRGGIARPTPAPDPASWDWTPTIAGDPAL